MIRPPKDADEKALARRRSALALNYLVNMVSTRQLPGDTVQEGAMQSLQIGRAHV